MKILFISSHHGTGASEALWIEAAVHLAAAGHEVSAAVNWRKHDRGRLAPLIQKGVSTCFLKLATGTGLMSKVLRRVMPLDSWELSAARRCMRRIRPDMIVFSEGNDISALPFLELAQEERMSYQIVTHGVNPAIWPADAIADRLRSVFTMAERTYWVAARNIEEFEHHIGARLPNAAVVRNPVKVDRNMPFQWPDPSLPLRMACVARLQTRAKGHDLLLQAIAQPEWQARNLQVSFYGDGENRRGLERLAKLLGIRGRVHFAGHVSHVQDIWRENHLIAQPSRNEGMPLSLVEALMCGRPAIATDVAGHAELITDGINGFIAEAATAHHIGVALERAWCQRMNWQAMGRLAYSLIREKIPDDPASDFAEKIRAAVQR